MVVPLFLQKNYFSSNHIKEQIFGVFLVGFLLLAADCITFRRQSFSISSQTTPNKLDNNFINLIAVALIGLQILHLLSMPNVPLFAKLFTTASQLELSQLREQSSKLLQIPTWFIYLAQTSILATPAIVYSFVIQRRYILGIFLAVFAAFYAFSTLAKGPILMFVTILLVLCYELMKTRYRFVIRTSALVVALVALGASGIEILSGKIEVARQGKLSGPINEKPGELSFTWGDHHRVFGVFPKGIIDWPLRFEKRSSSLLYRAIIVPPEVSHRWYTFYPEISGEYIGFYRLTPSTRNHPEYRSPSNTVGKWAYLQRFPYSYGESVHAYASVDADAYARWGTKGLIAVGIMIFVLRCLLGWLGVGGSFIFRSIFLSAITIIALGLPNSSLQAILVAHGVLIFLLVLLCLFLIEFFNYNRKRETPNQN